MKLKFVATSHFATSSRRADPQLADRAFQVARNGPQRSVSDRNDIDELLSVIKIRFPFPAATSAAASLEVAPQPRRGSMDNNPMSFHDPKSKTTNRIYKSLALMIFPALMHMAKQAPMLAT